MNFSERSYNSMTSNKSLGGFLTMLQRKQTPVWSTSKAVPDILLKLRDNVQLFLIYASKWNEGEKAQAVGERVFWSAKYVSSPGFGVWKGRSHILRAYREVVRSGHSALLPGLLSTVSSHENACRSTTKYLPLMWCSCEESSRGQRPCSFVRTN